MRARRAIRGALDGFIATVPMTAVMFGAQRLGLLGELPPKKITRKALDALHVGRTRETTKALTGVNHLAFGAGCGALYAMFAPGTRVATGALPGITYALGVWLGSYQGWVPAAGIMPPISRDYPGRARTMAFAHVVFGGVLGMLTARRKLRA